MRAGFSRASLVATLLATLLLPAPGSIADSNSTELRQTEANLEDVRRDIDELESKAFSLKDRIDVVNRAITELQIEVNRLDANIARIESEVRLAQAEIDKTQARIDRIKERATEQAVALYKAGATDTIDALLDAESLTELDNRAEMLGVAARENTGALVQYGRLQVEIKAQHRALFIKKKELDAERASRAKVLAEQSDLKTRLASDLGALNVKLGAKRDHEDDLEYVAAKLTGTIQALQAKRAVESLGTSAYGFIWPLNGGVTSPYGPRWGRMHTGIDIDGYSGQPIVASKAGRVILASYYSGYGNAVIVDHGGGIATLYAHMSAFEVSNGQSVEQGGVVGYVGCTGSCTGDHLHFEVRVNGSPVNPMDYLP